MQEDSSLHTEHELSPPTFQTEPDETAPEKWDTLAQQLKRRDFLRWGVAATATLLLSQIATACGPSSIPTEGTNSEATTEGRSDAGVLKAQPEMPQADPQDKFDPQEYDKAQNQTWNPMNTTTDAILFPYTVQAGAMKLNSALLWTFAPDNKPKTLRV